MARINVKRPVIFTHEGAPAKHINPEQQLRRSVMACMLWEKTFYEDGVSIADRIKDLVPRVDPTKCADIAFEARNSMYLRHVPLLIVREMARYDTHKGLVSNLLPTIINRPDELTEFLAIYWLEGRQPLSAQVKKGLANSMLKFNEYQLAKYNRPGQVKLRDILFLTHPKPKDKEQEQLFNRLANDTLEVPDTWEVALSRGGDKRSEWTRLLNENKLGVFALIRNLRNMEQAGVDRNLVSQALRRATPKMILPFRFIAAAQHAPWFEPELEELMFKSLTNHRKLPGHTSLLVDVSGSMYWELSERSKMERADAAFGLAILLREICDSVSIYSFSEDLIDIPPRRGFALRDAIDQSQDHVSTYLGISVNALYANKNDTIATPYSRRLFNGRGINSDRLIVITDEQSHDKVIDPVRGKGYMINVAAYKNGVGYGAWTHIDGWSDACISFIQKLEDEENE